MSRHRFIRNKKYSTENLSDDEYYDDDFGSVSPVTPGSRQFLYNGSTQDPYYDEPEQEDDTELVNMVINSILNSSNIKIPRDQLEAAVRRANYVVADALTILGIKNDNDMFGFDDDAPPGFEDAPPGFSSPSKIKPSGTAPQNNNKQPSHLAQNLNSRVDNYPAVKKPQDVFKEDSTPASPQPGKGRGKPDPAQPPPKFQGKSKFQEQQQRIDDRLQPKPVFKGGGSGNITPQKGVTPKTSPTPNKLSASGTVTPNKLANSNTSTPNRSPVPNKLNASSGTIKLNSSSTISLTESEGVFAVEDDFMSARAIKSAEAKKSKSKLSC